jgi:hypothetical protein
VSQCRLCLLPDRAPDAQLDAQHVCAFCHAEKHVDRDEQECLRQARAADLEAALESCRGQGEYDCLVNLSGGKDSCYLLHKLKVEYGLNVLAFTTDMNVPDVAWRNIQRTIDKLDVPHMSFIRRRASSIARCTAFCCKTRRPAAPFARFATSARPCSKGTPCGWRWKKTSR